MGGSNGACGGREHGAPAVIFFSFLCAAMLTLLYFNGNDFAKMPDVGQLARCLLSLLLLTAAYSCSSRGGLYLPLNAGLMGLVSAAVLCLMAKDVKEDGVAMLRLLPLLLLSVPVQFVMSVSGMRTAAVLRCALCRTPETEKELRPQNIMMLLAFVSSVTATGYIIFR